MPRFEYVVVVTGKLDAPTEENAALQAAMGVSLGGRLLMTPHQVAVRLREPPASPEPDGKKPRYAKREGERWPQ